MKRLLLVVMLLLFATSCSFVENILDKFDIEIGKPEIGKPEIGKPEIDKPKIDKPKTERRSVTRTPRVVNRVYSYAFEGHLNIRETPSFNARIIGKFRNGPEGGNLLQDLGGWSQVEVNGVVGYVVSRYLKRTPTIPYTGRVGLSWIEGSWLYNDGMGSGMCIYNNGFWSSGYDYPGAMGYYVMQNNEVKLVTVVVLNLEGPESKWEWTGAKGLPSEKGHIYKINERAGTLEGTTKCDYYPPYESEIVDYSLADFREEGKYTAKKVSAYMSK